MTGCGSIEDAPNEPLAIAGPNRVVVTDASDERIDRLPGESSMQDFRPMQDSSHETSQAIPDLPVSDAIPAWYFRAASLHRGDRFCLDKTESGFVSPQKVAELFATLGFSELTKGCFVRMADLSRIERMQASVMPTLTEVDAIAISSIFRPSVSDQYLYRTLRSLLDELPPEAIINVFVGGNQDSYVSDQNIVEQVGEANALRVHVIKVGPGVQEFFDLEEVPVQVRATWNYARVLRSYRGKKSLLFFEDDVELAKNSLQHLRPWLGGTNPELLALFSRYCVPFKPLEAREGTAIKIEPMTLPVFWAFPTTQGFAFSRQMAQKASAFMLPRSYTQPYDNLMGQLLIPNAEPYFMVHPSLVQHFGFTTTGLSFGEDFPRSRCYQPEFTRLEVDATVLD